MHQLTLDVRQLAFGLDPLRFGCGQNSRSMAPLWRPIALSLDLLATGFGLPAFGGRQLLRRLRELPLNVHGRAARLLYCV